jgi:hypothetical protein
LKEDRTTPPLATMFSKAISVASMRPQSPSY